jgi:hypothetical protein
METLESILLGIGLSAACGFRVFVPMLVMSIASITGHLTLASGFQWIGTYPALFTFAVATIVEIGGYYIPWLDHLLDSLASPAAIVAGTIVTAAMVMKMDPLLKWTLAVIVGGGVAGLIQGSTVLTRATSTATTGGFGNPVFATIELVSSAVISFMALLLPWLTGGLLLFCVVYFAKRLVKSARLVVARLRKIPQPSI